MNPLPHCLFLYDFRKIFLMIINSYIEAKLSQNRPGEGLRTALLQLLVSSDLTNRERAQITGLLRFLNTMQASSLPGESSDPIAFQLPIRDGSSTATADIRISRGGADGTVDPKRISPPTKAETPAVCM